MALESRWGGVIFPVSAGVVDSEGLIYSAGEPAVPRLIALLNSAITAELSARWDVIKAGTALASASVVGSTTYREADQGFLRSVNAPWPLLAVYRSSSEPYDYGWFTMSYRHVKSVWHVDYILGPLNEADHQRLRHFLGPVRGVVADVVWKRGHSSYESGTLQFGDTKGGIAGIDIVRAREDWAGFGEEENGMQILMLRCELDVVEIEDPHYSATAVPFEGADFSGEIMDNDQA